MPITTADIQTLEQHYRIDAPTVLDFVREHAFLYPILIEAVDVIRGQFPDATLALEVDDWDRAERDHQLMIFIYTTQTVAEAMQRLHRIDETWLFPNAEPSQYKLNIHLRFQ